MQTPLPALYLRHFKSLSARETPKLCVCNIAGKQVLEQLPAKLLMVAKHHAFTISQIVFFGAHTPQEYYR